MTFTELELRRIDKTVGELCRRLSPPQYGKELRLVYEVAGHDVSIWEERSPWHGQGAWTHQGIAKFCYLRSRQTWTLYSMRADLKWHVFEPAAPTNDLDALVAIVAENRSGAFFG
jgi:hypothetical protein